MGMMMGQAQEGPALGARIVPYGEAGNIVYDANGKIIAIPDGWTFGSDGSVYDENGILVQGAGDTATTFHPPGQGQQQGPPIPAAMIQTDLVPGISNQTLLLAGGGLLLLVALGKRR
jgi:hypothetical protein